MSSFFALTVVLTAAWLLLFGFYYTYSSQASTLPQFLVSLHNHSELYIDGVRQGVDVCEPFLTIWANRRDRMQHKSRPKQHLSKALQTYSDVIMELYIGASSCRHTRKQNVLCERVWGEDYIISLSLSISRTLCSVTSTILLKFVAFCTYWNNFTAMGKLHIPSVSFPPSLCCFASLWRTFSRTVHVLSALWLRVTCAYYDSQQFENGFPLHYVFNFTFSILMINLHLALQNKR